MKRYIVQSIRSLRRRAAVTKQFSLVIFYCAIAAILTACAASSSKQPYHPTKQDRTELAAINVKLGAAYLDKGNTTKAKQKLLLAIKQNPNNSAAWYTMGHYLEKVGEPKQAGSYYQKAVTIAPANGMAQNNYGTYLCRQKKYHQAIQHFKKAIEQTDYLYTAQAYENAGVCALAIPDRKAAKYYFTKSLKIDPNRPVALIELSKLEKMQHQYNKASHYITRYLKIYPATPAVLKLAIHIEKQTGNKKLYQHYMKLLKQKHPYSS